MSVAVSGDFRLQDTLDTLNGCIDILSHMEKVLPNYAMPLKTLQRNIGAVMDEITDSFGYPESYKYQ